MSLFSSKKMQGQIGTSYQKKPTKLKTKTQKNQKSWSWGPLGSTFILSRQNRKQVYLDNVLLIITTPNCLTPVSQVSMDFTAVQRKRQLMCQPPNYCCYHSLSLMLSLPSHLLQKNNRRQKLLLHVRNW